MSDNKKILRIALFFDGTAENGLNAQKNQPEKGGSYKLATTNVFKLYQLYKDKEENANFIYRKIYIEGIGTFTGGSDSMPTQASDLGLTSGTAKLESAAQQITRIIQQYKDIHSIYFEIFGFSRGATLARYAANLLAKRLNTNGSALIAIEDLKNKESQSKIKININFLGLFDTVVSSLANYDTSIDLGKIRNVIHLCAYHELRHFFPLLSVCNNDKIANTNLWDEKTSNRLLEVFLAGSHTDIGGGYGNVYNENSLLLFKKAGLRKNTINNPQWTWLFSDMKPIVPFLPFFGFRLKRNNLSNYTNRYYGLFMLDIYKKALSLDAIESGFMDNYEAVFSFEEEEIVKMMSLVEYCQDCKNTFIHNCQTPFSREDLPLPVFEELDKYADALHNSINYNPMAKEEIYKAPILSKALVTAENENEEVNARSIHKSTTVQPTMPMDKVNTIKIIIDKVIKVIQFLNAAEELLPNRAHINESLNQWERKIYTNQTKIDELIKKGVIDSAKELAALAKNIFQ